MQQIRFGCEKIQRTWSERKRRKREVAGNKRVEVPVYPATCLSEGTFVFEEDEWRW
jgi:hypothetical protein